MRCPPAGRRGTADPGSGTMMRWQRRCAAWWPRGWCRGGPGSPSRPSYISPSRTCSSWMRLWRCETRGSSGSGPGGRGPGGRVGGSGTAAPGWPGTPPAASRCDARHPGRDRGGRSRGAPGLIPGVRQLAAHRPRPRPRRRRTSTRGDGSSAGPGGSSTRRGGQRRRRGGPGGGRAPGKRLQAIAAVWARPGRPGAPDHRQGGRPGVGSGRGGVVPATPAARQGPRRADPAAGRRRERRLPGRDPPPGPLRDQHCRLPGGYFL